MLRCLLLLRGKYLKNINILLVAFLRVFEKSLFDSHCKGPSDILQPLLHSGPRDRGSSFLPYLQNKTGGSARSSRSAYKVRCDLNEKMLLTILLLLVQSH